MMTRQLYGINHCNKDSFAEKHMLSPLKSKQVQFEDKMETYFSHHPLALWIATFVGMPIGILLAVGLVTTIFGLMILGVTSLI